jgi:hypothetical protein
MESSAEFRISNLGPRAASTRDTFAFAVLEANDVVIRCPLGDDYSLNDKLVWLWGGLNHQRRKLKALQAEGAVLSCVCINRSGKLVLQPNAAEFLHLTGASLVVTTGDA